MSGFVDIHTHILPGVDDGAADLQQACDMVRMAYENGTVALFLTPHYRDDYSDYSPARLQMRFAQLQNLIAEEVPEVQLYLGTEVRFDSGVPEKLQQGQILAMNGSRFVLLEFSHRALRSQILLGVSELLRYGFTPVIAHAERCNAFYEFPELMAEVLRLGACIQINAGSVMGCHGFAVKRFTRKLLKARQVHFVASDAHDCQNRTPLLKKCFLWVSKKCGQEYAKQVFCANAREMMEPEEK